MKKCFEFESHEEGIAFLGGIAIGILLLNDRETAAKAISELMIDLLAKKEDAK